MGHYSVWPFIKWQSFRLVQIESLSDNNVKETKKLKFDQRSVENIVGEEDIACYQHALNPLFPNGIY